MSVSGEQGRSAAGELKNYVAQLQSAIEELDTVRKHLQHNAHQVRCEIHSTVSRELEALRTREVWLLTQVDLLQHVKEDILRGQQAEISTELGRALAQTDGQDMLPDVDNISRLELTDLEPEETAQISFHADTTGLRSTIMEFGRLDVGGRGLQKAFAAAHTPSASLPKPFEEYDDAEHHVLYKTLEEINRGKTESTSIQVNIPKLAMKPEEWLIAPAPSRDTKPVTKSDKLAFPTLSTDMSDWVLAGRSADQGTDKGRKPLLTRNRSIQDWLLQIKHFPHTQDEEEEYDFVEHVTISEASDSGMDIPTNLSSPVVVTSSNGVSPAQVTPTTMTTWLVSDSATQPSPAVKEVPAFSHMFKHNQGDIKEWLINSGGSSRSGSQSPEPVEIENLACMLDRTIFLHKADDKAVWLVGGRNNSRVPPITVVCKANEPCLRHGECVSSPPCGDEYLSPSQGENIWLLNSTGPWEDTSQKPRFFYNHDMSDNYADWVYSSKQPDTILSSSGEKLDAGVFASWSASVSNKTSDWLKNCDPRGASPLTSNDNKDCIPQPFSCDIGAWLLKDSGGQENTYMPFSEVFKALSPANLSNWITRYEEGDHTTQVDVDSESEKRDTTSEKLEMAKWLLDGVRDSPSPTCPVSVTKNSGLGLWLFDKQLEW